MASKAARTYVVSGSASGIGRATKQLIESEGHRVIGVDIRNAEVIADLGTRTGRAALIEQVTTKSGGVVDAVLAIAGIDGDGPATVAINYYGALATLHGLRPLLLKSEAPRAVAVSSITSVHPFDPQLLNVLLDGSEENALARAREANYVYATTKRALSRWIRRNAINAEWAGAGIPLNAIAPGLVKTELLMRLFENPEIRRAISGGTPMPLKGPYEPIEAAELLAWLASERNGHMTGQTIFLDGGADVALRGDSTWWFDEDGSGGSAVTQSDRNLVADQQPYASARSHSASSDLSRRGRPVPNENCRLLMRCACSIPAMAMAALSNDLKPAIEAKRGLIARWSCSTILLRFLRLLTSTFSHFGSSRRTNRKAR